MDVSEICLILYFRKADEGLQKVNQTEGRELHTAPQDITNKHIMAYGMYMG